MQEIPSTSKPPRCPDCHAALYPDANFCHHCGAPVAGRDLRAERAARAVRFVRVLLWVDWGVCLLALVLIAAVETESVLATGPVAVILGVVTILQGSKADYPGASLIGMTHCGICAALFLLVVFFTLGPNQARQPLLLIGGAYTLALLPITAYVYLHHPPLFDPARCARCGYLLFGLTEPRCPECAKPFDPASVPAPPTAPLPSTNPAPPAPTQPEA